ncbi:MULTISPECIES: hypothetical protein [Nostocales]|uniref:Uncharacterized protein n=1 Tax=Tolypothrix bouteillei VB521301 TaxID=1479485 RepID=A0A8S9T8T9_9CYAN|nr:hypothetical protein DA73_0400021880 [Tolypothrix bouteillei VB521301]
MSNDWAYKLWAKYQYIAYKPKFEGYGTQKVLIILAIKRFELVQEV